MITLTWHHRSAVMSQVTDMLTDCSTACSGWQQRKYQGSALMAHVRKIHWWPVDSLTKGQSYIEHLKPWRHHVPAVTWRTKWKFHDFGNKLPFLISSDLVGHFQLYHMVKEMLLDIRIKFEANWLKLRSQDCVCWWSSTVRCTDEYWC